jgi:hypothetical protein
MTWYYNTADYIIYEGLDTTATGYTIHNSTGTIWVDASDGEPISFSYPNEPKKDELDELFEKEL